MEYTSLPGIITSDQYILERMAKFWIDCEPDVTLTVEGVDYHCHRDVLAECSEYFSKMFFTKNPNYVERTERRIKLWSVNRIGFLAFLDFAYTSEVLLSKENIKVILITANMLCSDTLEKTASDFLKDYITTKNAVGYYKFAQNYGLLELQKFLIHFLFDKIEEIIRNKSYVYLPYDFFRFYFNEIDLTQQRYFELVFDWAKFDVENRLNDFSELIRTIRFKDFDGAMESVLSAPAGREFSDEEELLTKKVKEEMWRRIYPIIRDDKMFVIQKRSGDFMDIFSYTRELKWKYTIDSIRMTPSYIKPVLYNNNEIYFYFYYCRKLQFAHINNQSNNDKKRIIKICNLVKSENHSMKNMVLQSIVSINHSSNDIYTSFHAGRENCPSVYSYNAETNELRSINQSINSNFITSRLLATTDRVLYLCGGFHVKDRRFVNLITRYDPRCGKFENCGRFFCNNKCYWSVTILNNRIYATGGWENVKAEDVVERYDIRSGKSELVAKMHAHKTTRRSTVTFNNKIWVADSSMHPVECYTEKSDRWTKKTNWTRILNLDDESLSDYPSLLFLDKSRHFFLVA